MWELCLCGHRLKNSKFNSAPEPTAARDQAIRYLSSPLRQLRDALRLRHRPESSQVEFGGLEHYGPFMRVVPIEGE